MIFFGGFGGLVVFALWVFCFIDVLITPEGVCRSLPKLAWVFIVLLLPLFGAIAWLIAGHPWRRRDGEYVSDRSSSRLGEPAASRPAARPSLFGPRGSVPRGPDDDPEFLATLSARAKQARRAREKQDRDDDIG